MLKVGDKVEVTSPIHDSYSGWLRQGEHATIVEVRDGLYTLKTNWGMSGDEWIANDHNIKIAKQRKENTNDLV